MLGEDAENTIRRADEGLYKSKEAGRNCCHWHDGSQCLPIGKPNAAATSEDARRSAIAAMATDLRVASESTFIQVLNRRIPESRRFGIPVSVIRFTIEDYDAIHSTHGQAAARHIFELAANVLQHALREMDMVALLDDGEFVVMMPGSALAEAEQMAEQMQASLNDCVIPLMDCEQHVRFRYGFAELNKRETAQELLARARAQTESLAGVV
jgi:diguanylate cyclase